MKLFIVRHGEAVDAEDDRERVLSVAGRERTVKTAAFLAKNGVKVGIIYHSVKTRARETAVLISDSIKPSEGILEAEGLKPNDPIGPWLLKINGLSSDAMIVGHLPFLSKLLSGLAAGNDKIEIALLKDSSAVCLEKESEGRWRILWFVNPDII